MLSAVLLFTALFRDAGWVLLWTLTASFFFASMAFAARNPASRQGAVGVLTGAFALLRNLPSTPRFLAAPLRGARSRNLVGPVVLTVLFTVILLLVFGLLFALADAVFAGYLYRVFSGLFSEPGAFNPIGDLFAMVVAVLLTGAAVLAARRRHAPKTVPHPGPAVTESDRTPLPVWVWTIPLSALVLLFTAFLAVQAVAMFGGEDHVQRVAGVTYAEYARQGFFQLVVVSALVLGVIAVAVRVLPSRPTATRTLRNALLGLLCVLTLVILASAMMRLQLYIDAFGLTRLRASAEAWILWSAGVFGLVVAAGVFNTLGRPTAWLPRVTVALSGAALAVFAYGNPDLRIAESHHDPDLAVVDTWYLRDLSTDAIPALMELEETDRDCALLGFQDRVEDLEDMDLASWNLSRHRGYQQLDELGLFEIGAQANLDCSVDRAPDLPGRYD
ncbi:histidine kinase [Nocardiopsis sp. TSRI0078]|nr:histidine kinase [Nocardiopsis sp. TSRI0078]